MLVPAAHWQFAQKFAFTPEDIQRLTDAFESALLQLNLENSESAEAEEVARRIFGGPSRVSAPSDP